MTRSENMYKTNIFALKEDRAYVVEELHKMGIMQMIDLKSSDVDLQQAVPGEEHKMSSDLLLRISRLINIQKMAPQKLSMPQSMFGLDLLHKKSIKRKKESDVIRSAESFMEKHEQILLNLEQEYVLAQEREEQLTDNLAALRSLDILGIPIGELRSTENIFVLVGRLPYVRVGELKKELNKELDGYFEFFTKEIDSKRAMVAIVSMQQDQPKVTFSAKKSGLASISVPDIEHDDPIAYVEEEIEGCKSTKNNVLKEIKKRRSDMFEESVVLREELEILKEKTESLHKMKESERFFMLQGWVPESSLDDVRSIKNTTVTSELAPPTMPMSEEEEENAEDVPVKLVNKSWLKPFEMITELYSAPKYKDLDPTFVVGPIFVIFAGFMLTDFFYGLGLVLLGAILITKFGKYDPGLKELCISIVGIGSFSMIFGILTGSYLGDLAKYLIGMESAELAIWRDPLTDPLYFLIISIIVAVIHVNIGLILGAVEDFRKKQYKEFVSERLVWWVLQVAIACFLLPSVFPAAAGALSLAGKVLGILAVLIIVGMKGPLGLLDITGFMGDVISYSRLFALALSTAGIAMTVNLLADLLWPIPYGIGIVAALMVFIGGHLFSFAMNALGSFVHSIRLQFVEFFGKFYEGGGNSFAPFKEERLYTVIGEGDGQDVPLDSADRGDGQ